MLVAQLLSLSLQGVAVRPPAGRSRLPQSSRRLTALRMVAASKEDAESNARLLQALLDEGGEDGCLVDKVWSTICEEENSMVKDPAIASHLQLDLDDEGKPLQLRFLYVDELDCIGCTYCASIARNSFMMEPEAGRARLLAGRRRPGDHPRGHRQLPGQLHILRRPLRPSHPGAGAGRRDHRPALERHAARRPEQEQPSAGDQGQAGHGHDVLPQLPNARLQGSSPLPSPSPSPLPSPHLTLTFTLTLTLTTHFL